MILWSTDDNYEENLLLSYLLQRFHGYGDVTVHRMFRTESGIKVSRQLPLTIAYCLLIGLLNQSKTIKIVALITCT